MLPRISIIIGTLNQNHVLEKVLSQYASQTCSKHDFEVIVVDSTSTDGTIDMLANFEADFQFKYIVQPNQGKAAARNRGVKEARGAYIIITDADMVPHPQFVFTHLTAQVSTQTPTCFEGVTLNMDRLAWPPTEAQLTPYIQRPYPDRQPLGWYYFLTGNISFPKPLFESFRGFNEVFKGYGWEDLELGYRMSLKKIPLYYLKEAINYHYHVVSEDEEIERNVAKGKSAKVFLQLHPKLKWFLGLNPISRWVFACLTEKSWLYRYAQKCYKSSSPKKHGFGVWFLKEFNYLKGILG
jgi:glycosyltransferase involved in cell wall biosynthesis